MENSTHIAHIAIASRSDPGQVRSQNEDSVAHHLPLGLAILADGMGGYNAGEVASGMATAALKAQLEAQLPPLLQSADAANLQQKLHALMREAIAAANTAIYQMAISRQQYNGMGTTLVLALFYGQQMTVAHLGDSRMYRWRQGQLQQITLDHSVLQEQINAGVLTAEQARGSAHKNLVTRALGVEEVVQPDIADHVTEVGDIYMLCSDGMSDMVDDAGINALLSRHAATGDDNALEAAAQALIAAANEQGGRDNVSVVLIKCLPAPSKSLVQRFWKWLK